MNILYLLVPVALLLAGAGVWGFLWSVRSGQFDDVETPAIRMLLEEEATLEESARQRAETARNGVADKSSVPN